MMPGNRRGLLGAALASIGAALALSATQARAETATSAPDMRKVVYHLADLDKVAFVLGIIQNHFDGMGGPDKVTIALVIHGPALKAFHAASANPDVTQRVAKYASAGVQLAACGKTMKAQEITLKDLLPGFAAAEEGGVVRLAELQSQGYVYLRP
jgi:intracellular sulfur oxidation DsrE/DsrF family protein